MPLYDFRCRSCETAFEERTAVGELPPCPVCGATDVVRLYGPVASYRGPAPRGATARRSDSERRVREERRWEGFRKQREERGLPPREQPPP
jgi:putative FmdB family regulatory protein